ncbi:MAG TPA: family 10 glycosylhydrolase [Armatimonadota bacterium]|jgi:hypothetical protein
MSSEQTKSPSLLTFNRAQHTAQLRQIHLDFHTPGCVTVGDKFNAVEFFDTLEAADVNSITPFALCHHGYSYFDTRTGCKHPGLAFDLFGAIAEEAARRKMELLAYFSQNVNEVQAARHPEWHALQADGQSVNSQILQDGSELYWTWLCPNRKGFIEDFFLPQIAEVLARYPLDGIFIDMACYLHGSCFCPDCVTAMRQDGLDPDNLREHIQFNIATNQRVAREVRALLDATRPGLRFEVGCFNAFGEAEGAAGVISEFYVESLAFQTGWQYFPLTARYFRKYALPTVGVTGRFLKNWGDFGTVITPHQLKTQLAMHLMAGVASCIGDHVHCNGQLDPAVYRTIGEAFRFAKARQPYCVGTTAAKELAILVPEGVEVNVASDDKRSPFLSLHDAYKGAGMMASALHYQYDLIAARDAFDGYAAVIVSNGLFDASFVERARRFMAEGGWLFVSGQGLLPGDATVRRAWQDLLGVADYSPSLHLGEYYEVSNAKAQTDDLPAMPHYVHEPAYDIAFDAEVEPVAQGWRSPIIRSREAFYGHFHGPATEQAGPSIGITRHGNGGAVIIAPQVFPAYLHTGNHAHRKLLRNLLDCVLPDTARVLRTNAPTVVELACGEIDGHLVLQALPFIAEQRDRASFESLCEDPIAFHGIWVDLPQASNRKRAYDPIAGQAVTIEQRPQGIRVYLPPFSEHLVVIVE